jgi:hypothetical protein
MFPQTFILFSYYFLVSYPTSSMPLRAIFILCFIFEVISSLFDYFRE